MEIKLHDNVRFLNAIGGGKVTGFKGKDIVLVEDEDGFEIPALRTEVVVVEETNQYNFVVDDPLKAIKDRNKSKNTTPQASVTRQEDDDFEPEPKVAEYSWNERFETRDGERLSVYLAFVPKDIKQLQTTDMALYLVNDSNYYLHFTLASGENQASLRSHDTIEPQTKLYIETVNKLALNEFANLRFQAVAYKKIAYDAKPAIDMPISINPTKFYKLHSFGENDYFSQDAMLVTVIKDDVLDLAQTIDPVKIQMAMASKERPQTPRHSPPHHRNLPVIEVDLHIHQLVDNYAGMSNADMLTLQLEAFDREMKQNIKNKGQKIVFIHGKGEGVLRAEIEKRLKRFYRSCEYQDASFQQYGFGATQVTIH